MCIYMIASISWWGHYIELIWIFNVVILFLLLRFVAVILDLDWPTCLDSTQVYIAKHKLICITTEKTYILQNLPETEKRGT